MAFGLSLVWGYFACNCNEKSYINIFVSCFHCGWIKSKSETAELYGKGVCNFIRNCQTVFQSCGITLHIHQPGSSSRIPVAPHPCQHLLWSIFLILVFLLGMYWYIIIVSMCISLTINDGRHCFTGVSDIHMFSCVKCLFNTFANLVLGLCHLTVAFTLIEVLIFWI